MLEQLRAGVSTIDISPKQGLQLAGYPHYKRANTGIHDPLYASCIYLENKHNKIAIVSLDLIKYPKRNVKAVRERIEKECCIPGQNIMICCTHTHSGPLMSAAIDMEGIEKGIKPDPEYIKEVEDKIVFAVMQAYNSTFPAKAGTGKGYCGKEHGVGGNRENPDGPADPEVWTIGIMDMEGRWRGCIVKYALHPTLIHGESTVVSADYPCYIRRYLAETKPGINFLFMQGTSGNQSSRYFRNSQSFAEAKRIGEAIAKEADKVLDSMLMSSDIDLIAKSIETEIALRDLPKPDELKPNIEKQQQNLKKLKDDNAPYVEIRTAEVDLLGAENIYGYALAKANGYLMEALITEMPVEIQVIGIGDVKLVGLQGEIFVEFGLDIKSKSPFDRTFVVELANGGLPGYLCTRQAYEEGGYEAGTSILSEKSGDMLVNAVIELLNNVKAEHTIM